jgi:hypothetical protein
LHEGGNDLCYLSLISNNLDTIFINNEKYSLYLNEVRKNLAAPGKLLLRCSTTYVPVGDLDRSPLMRSYGYASAGDQSTLFARFPLSFVPFMQYPG